MCGRKLLCENGHPYQPQTPRPRSLAKPDHLHIERKQHHEPQSPILFLYTFTLTHPRLAHLLIFTHVCDSVWLTPSMQLRGMFGEWITRSDDLDGDVEQLSFDGMTGFACWYVYTRITLRRWHAAMKFDGLPELNIKSCFDSLFCNLSQEDRTPLSHVEHVHLFVCCSFFCDVDFATSRLKVTIICQSYWINFDVMSIHAVHMQ